MVGKLILSVAICCVTITGYGQSASWKPAKIGTLSLRYPPSWHYAKETRGKEFRISITPDSMQHLGMRMFIIFPLSVNGEHNFAFFKKNFNLILRGAIGSDGKIVKTAETTFRGHKCMYAEAVESSLPEKVYGVDGGDLIYVIIVMPRRYVSVADPGIERDENGILNSIVFTP
jgi:hypothetical protein